MKDNFEDYDHFIDDNGTIYQKIDDEFYDYKLNDEYGTDYCTVNQMKSWKVKVAKVITTTEV